MKIPVSLKVRVIPLIEDFLLGQQSWLGTSGTSALTHTIVLSPIGVL